MRQFLLLITLFIPLLSYAENETSNETLLRLATTTTVEDSGLLEYLLPFFLKRHPYKVDLLVAGSGKALRMGRTGAVDVVWVHSPPAENKFIEQGYGINRQTVMRNDFVLVGPGNDPGGIATASNIFEAFQRIASKELLFVSRADDSGTNKKELSLWKKAGIDPYGADWYHESGAGMAESLLLAQQENAYMIIDRATFEVRHGEGIRVILEDPINLFNPYSVIAVNPEKVKGVNDVGVSKLIDWLVSKEGQELIEAYTHRGQQLYFPTRLEDR
jgi:tungstate transport system substrate-binding protein